VLAGGAGLAGAAGTAAAPARFTWPAEPSGAGVPGRGAAATRTGSLPGGGCRTPVGILAQPLAEGAWRLTAMLASPDGAHLMRRQNIVAAATDPREAAAALAREMLADAPPQIREMLKKLSDSDGCIRGNEYDLYSILEAKLMLEN